jgi:alpha 1,2-mannosyltransferase
MPSFLMDLAFDIETRLGIDKQFALQLAEREAARLRSRFGRDALGRPELDGASARVGLDAFMAAIPPYDSGQYGGDGLVICAGGRRQFRYAWVCINMLRRMQCRLPIELWHFGPYELDETMAALVRPLDVMPVNALEIRKAYPSRNLLGYAIKPYAMLHCSFSTVLLIDADNVPVDDVNALLTCPELEETGSVFWPDEEPISATNPIWDMLSLRPAAPSFESGQVLVRKSSAWTALQTASYLTSHGDFYYRHLRGDRDCFQVAWLATNTPYRIVPFPMRRIPGAMLQYDFAGHVLFQHRNAYKWDDPSQRSPGFAFEEECFDLLRDLDRRWDGNISGRRG